MLDLYEIGLKLTDLRQNANYTQAEIAERLQVSHQAISRWETGKTLPSVDNLILLSELFHASIEEMLCMNVKGTLTSIEEMFQTKDRMFLVHEVVFNRLGEYTLCDVIHLLSQDERDYAIHLYLKYNLPFSKDCFPRLSIEERMRLIQAYLHHNYPLPLNEISYILTPAEIKKLKEKYHDNRFNQNVTFSRNRRTRRVSNTNFKQRSSK